ncbi:MAG: short-chain dehydrogenase, partial [Asticcacaulis sp. 32-58-5]
MLLENKVMLITGASKGIGRGIAVGAAKHGAKIGINYAGDDAAAAATVAEIKAAGGEAFALKGDVSDPQSAKDFIQAGVDNFGKIDSFVSNAGICPFHAFLDMPQEVLERTLRVNLHGAWYMSQA